MFGLNVPDTGLKRFLVTVGGNGTECGCSFTKILGSVCQTFGSPDNGSNAEITRQLKSQGKLSFTMSRLRSGVMYQN